MSTSIKNVAIAGASGNIGKPVFKALVDSGKFNVTVIRRNGSSSTYAEGIKVVDADFDSVDSLTAALAGQDAVVATLGAAALGQQQKNLVDASVAAGVQRFIPSEFGCDMDNELTAKLPVFLDKAALQVHLKEKARTTQLSYTPVYSCPFLDWGLRVGFLLKTADSKPEIYDGGDAVFSTTTTESVGAAVVGVLLHPEETKNRPVFVQSTKTTQNKLLALAKEVAPERPWEVQNVKLDDVTAVADERLAKGLFDHHTFVPYIKRAIFDPAYGSDFQQNDNELLGIKEISDEDIKAIFRSVLNK